MNDEEEELGDGFKMGGEDDEDEPLDMPEDLDFGLDEEDPERDS
jgi:hypothetical protein